MGAGRARVRACRRLGEAEGGELAPAREVGQPLPLLLLGSEEQKRHRPERGVRGDRDRHGGVDPRQLLDRDGVGERVAPRATVLLRDGDAHEAELGQLGDDLVREAVLAVELLCDGRDPLLGERADGVAQELVLVREVEVHGYPDRRRASSASSLTP